MSPLIAQIAPAIWSHAVRVFGTEEKATRWMATRLRQLGERTPEEVLTLSPQSPEIEALLGRIEYVVYS
jgi:putative toxin-antitoxin system antitoxin component (TIGR02293 family)